MKLTNADRIKILDARILRAESQQVVEDQYEYREKHMHDVISVKDGKERMLINDYIQALTENNEVDAEMERRFS